MRGYPSHNHHIILHVLQVNSLSLSATSANQCLKEKPSSVIFAFSDVFGVLSGRHRRICDDIAASVPGSLVCLPDLFHGDPIAPDFSDSRFPRMRQKLFMPKMVYRIRYRFGWAQVRDSGGNHAAFGQKPAGSVP